MKLELLDFKEFPDYPSASGIEFYNDRIYLVGDDAKDILVLNKKWNKPEVIHLFDQPEDRIPKDMKSDLETMTLIQVDKKPHLLVLGSGATESRNRGLLLNLKNYQHNFLDLSVFYNRLKAMGIAELNIEAVASVYDYMVLASRGNKTNPDNQLIITSPNFWRKQKDAPIQIIKIDLDEYVAKGMGISGLTYSDKHEDLLLTFSTEDTSNAIDDGPIGKSYLGIIENLYRKIGREKIKMRVNELFDLPATDKRFNGYKIESVCIQSEKDHSMKLHLAADNDTGSSFLFKVWMSW